MENNSRFRKSIWIPLLLTVYSTGCFLYFLPRNHEVSTTEKWVTVVVNYLIIAAIFWALRKKEKLKQEREDDLRK